VLPDFPGGLADYKCTAFPDEAKPEDALIVGLIALAVALPVTLFLSSTFELASDNDAPESWLEYTGGVKVLFGQAAHRLWHYTGPKGQPPRLVRWYCRSGGAPVVEMAWNAVLAARAWVTCSDPPWVAEAREREREEQAAQKVQGKDADADADGGATRAAALLTWAHGAADADVAAAGSPAPPVPASATSAADSADELAHFKQALAWSGVAGLALTWTLFGWFTLVYGQLIYQLLGPATEGAFVRSWAVSYGMGSAMEWKDVVRQALRALLVLVLLELLLLTPHDSWLEQHVDYLSLQALLYRQQQRPPSLYGQLRLLMAHTKRVVDDD
jgi:hypothetical protein